MHAENLSVNCQPQTHYTPCLKGPLNYILPLHIGGATKYPRLINSPVNEAHGMDPIQSQHYLSRVKAGPFLWNIVVAHQVHQVTTRHVFHHHIEVAVVLECKKELQDRKEKRAISNRR